MSETRTFSFERILPPDALDLLCRKVSAEFATVSAAGVPIDTPVFVFPNADLTTLDVGTGLAYPAKAERARRNPKVGLLLEGSADEPVISIAGHATVHDADIQANLERYLAETIFSPNVAPEVVPWERTRERLYYLARVIVAVAPVHVRWWPCREAMDQPPSEWRAPAGMVLRPSDPAPAGSPSPAPAWRQPSWQELASQALAGGMPAHLTLLDPAGYPLPIRVESVAAHARGFRLQVPRGAPWQQGSATLSFVGKEIFVGVLERDGDEAVLSVERALPILPMMDDRAGLSPETLAALNERLRQELARRGQPMPTVPEIPPEPTAGALRRAEASRAIDPASVGAGISR